MSKIFRIWDLQNYPFSHSAMLDGNNKVCSLLSSESMQKLSRDKMLQFEVCMRNTHRLTANVGYFREKNPFLENSHKGLYEFKY